MKEEIKKQTERILDEVGELQQMEYFKGRKEREEEILEWCYKNNTIPLPNSTLRLATTDGGWINVLKLQEFLKDTKV